MHRKSQRYPVAFNFGLICTGLLIAVSFSLLGIAYSEQAMGVAPRVQQRSSAQRSVEKPGVWVSRVQGQKPLIIIDGKPTAIFFARGVKEAGQLQTYREAGFNTVWLDISWQPGAEEVFEILDEFVQAIAKQKLYLIIGIDTIPPKGSGVRMSIYDARYVTWVQNWIAQVIQHFSKYRHVIGWATGHFPDQRGMELGAYDDIGFQAYLSSTYHNVQQLSTAWGTPVTNLARVTQVAAMTVDDLQSPIRYGHSSLSAALYRWCSLRWLMALWGATIKRYDNQRPLFTGMLSTYRAIISVPAMYDVVVPAVYPAVAEADWQTHNVHAVDMARRANASIAIPVYASQIQKEQVSIGRLMPWIELAALHGAGGVGFNSWKPFDENDELRASLSQLLDELNATGAFLATPAPTAAFLYIPFGEGFTVQEAPLYGFATPHGQPIATPPRLSIGEPNKLFASFQLGTRYGQFDYISLETLSQTAVNRYSAIFAPVPLYMSSSITGPNGQPMPALGIPTAPALLQRLGVRADPTWINPAAWLAQYVSAGGVLVTDIGASLAVGGDTFRLLPPDFAQLIGAAGIRLLIVDPNIALSMSVLFNHPLFPSLPAGSRIGATTTPFRTVAGVLRFMSARAWALMMRAPRRRRRISREAVAMCINAIGRGFVVHAPTLLWANWLPQSPDFIAFHNDLLKRRAAVNLISARGLFSPNVHVALFTDGVAFLNVSTQTQLAIAEVATGAHARSTLMNAHVEFPAGSNSSAVLVRQVIQPLEFAFVGLLPIRVQCNSRFVAVVNDYSAKRIKLSLYGPDAKISSSGGRLVTRATKSLKAKVFIASGAYRVTPGSSHKVQMVVLNPKLRSGAERKRTLKASVKADERGIVTLAVEGAIVQIAIEAQSEHSDAEGSTNTERASSANQSMQKP